MSNLHRTPPEPREAPQEPQSGWLGLLGFAIPFVASAAAMGYLVYWAVSR